MLSQHHRHNQPDGDGGAKANDSLCLNVKGLLGSMTSFRLLFKLREPTAPLGDLLAWCAGLLVAISRDVLHVEAAPTSRKNVSIELTTKFFMFLEMRMRPSRIAAVLLALMTLILVALGGDFLAVEGGCRATEPVEHLDHGGAHGWDRRKPSSPKPTVVQRFCQKTATPNVVNYGYHIRIVSPTSNILAEAPSFLNYALFDLYPETGALVIPAGNAWAGIGQTTRLMRYSDDPTAYPYYFACRNPDDVYTSGSILKCSVTAPWPSLGGAERSYTTFSASTSSPSGAWTLKLDGLIRAGAYDYDVAIDFGPLYRGEL
ncbi:hypothetical protein B0H66DRAFT_621973 [Apodospora peruviana]|uniref:Uncharacterized protein n=1 Tax=Apodospora peruviana TaxID=516989 RepID=A0AAE0I3Z7_9PEZI|nr:hypothetical protein B0H66DRAFT_621973 [Apodospora peruviana]